MIFKCIRKNCDTDDIDGGVQHYFDEGAPKDIKSTRIQSFSCEFSAYDLALTSSFVAGQYHTFYAAEDGGSYEARSNGEICAEREFIPAATFLNELQQIVEKYDFAQYNGQFYTVSGLPPDYGIELEILYDSGERIRCSDNQSCFISVGAMEELVSLFYSNNSSNLEQE